MEEAIKILAHYGLNRKDARGVAYNVATAMTYMWELEDVEYVAEEMGLQLTDSQKRDVLAWWRSGESYGELDRDGIERAIKETIKENK